MQEEVENRTVNLAIAIVRSSTYSCILPPFLRVGQKTGRLGTSPGRESLGPSWPEVYRSSWKGPAFSL